MKPPSIFCAALLSVASSSVLPAQPTVPTAPPQPAPFPGVAKLVLPARIYAVPGVETNVYFDNICLMRRPEQYVVDVTCSKGKHQTERWTFVPTEQDIGSYPFSIEIRDDANKIVGRVESILEVAPANAGSGKSLSLLTIGDSLTQPMLYQARLLELCKPETNPRIRLVGHCPSDNFPDFRTEGYGGWTAERFVTYFKDEKRKTGDWRVWNDSSSPFLYSNGEGKSRLDFQRYCQEFNEGRSPDIVTILLGTNDMICTTDDAVETAIETMFKNYDALIDMVRQENSQTKIGVMLPPPPAGTQDAFGENFQSGLARWQYKQRQHRLVERMIEKYGHRESESIFLVPVYANLDCMHNFPTLKSAANSHSKTEIERQSNAVHPANEGQLQIGDTLYAWIKGQYATDR